MKQLRLKQDFYAQETSEVARNLIGKLLFSSIGEQVTSGRIVETEAYLPSRDSACHASKHRTARTEIMFGPAGFAYVYPIHAKHCFNVVTESEELGCAVLIRALEPIDGIGLMKKRRGLDDRRRLTTGPGCLCQAMAIDRESNSIDLTSGDKIWLERAIGCKSTSTTIKTSKRIGVTSAKTRRLRFYDAGNPFVSGPIKMRT